MCLSTGGRGGTYPGQLQGAYPPRPSQDGGRYPKVHNPWPGQDGGRGTPRYLPPWPGQDGGKGYLPPPPGQLLATRRAVCFLRSRRRNFLFYIMFSCIRQNKCSTISLTVVKISKLCRHLAWWVIIKGCCNKLFLYNCRLLQHHEFTRESGEILHVQASLSDR